ncbi:MAG: hypothetical protein A3G34_09305 [Candidatus Lindowbacteria bacterium RIFCSPLOWO2_12_FULL_62_27]|nr:MAG: hypothetical protein A3I06_07970 [Candidatus Lindowbacteria bacterium RIFCSPLOWO2_02_FULL_62_12]OGH60234.1 MAG: hypothetical protein A3G34_09305 [Candidatus Lindowbacteria bacterium RIFCSPLOWO2_12_FULL_62_27]
MTPPPAPSVEFFGPFRIIREVGHGGMGNVYLAESPQGGPPVALKVLPQHLSKNERFRERFKRECASLRKLNHPGIPRHIDDGEVDGRRYVVMEFLEGRSLEWVLAHPPSGGPDLAVRVIRDLAGILSYAHGVGIIHRDISPKNVIVNGATGIKLVDFGISKLVDEATLTMTGQHFGTPAYMAPEQFESRAAIDARSDLWSIGVIAYEILAGRTPYEARNIASITATLLNPSYHIKFPSEVKDGVSQKLDLIVMRCLCREPAGRYGSCADLLRDLDSDDPIPQAFAYRSDRAYIPGEVFYHAQIACHHHAAGGHPPPRGAVGQVVRSGKIGRRGVIEAEIGGRTYALSSSRPAPDPGGGFVSLRRVAIALIASLAAFAAGAPIGWVSVTGGGQRAYAPESQLADEDDQRDEVDAPAISTKQAADDALPWAAKLNLKIERIRVGGRTGTHARTYEVQGGKYYLYAASAERVRRMKVYLNPALPRLMDKLGPWFLVVETDDLDEVFVIPGNILSTETMEKFVRANTTSSTRYATVRSGGKSALLQSGEWELDLTPYKNAFHLLK